MSEPPYGWEGDELERAAHRIIKRLPETQLEVENEELKQEVEQLRAECLRLQAELGHGRDERAKLRAELAKCEQCRDMNKAGGDS